MNGKRLIKTTFAFMAFIAIIANVSAQDSQTLYYMNRIPQSSYMNPALQPKCNFFLGLPVISSLQIGAGNNRLALTDVIMKNSTGDSLITFLHPDADFNTNDFLDKLDENNFFYYDLKTDILSFGFRTGSWYFTVNISEKLSLAVNYPKDLLSFALEGNTQFINSNANFNYLGINSTAYREYGLGISKQFSQNFSVGGRIKFLFGHANVYSDYDANTLDLYTSRDSLYINADVEINTSSPLEVTTNADGDFNGFDIPSNLEDSLVDLALAHNNMGLGIDLGIYYRPFDKLSLSLSIIDFGYIKWEEQDVTSLKLKGNYAFKGIDASSYIGGDENAKDPMDEMLDSLENSFTISNDSKSYKTSLGTKIYVGASFMVSKKFDLSFLSRTYYFNSNLNQAFTLSANVRPINGISASLSYSYMNGSYNNVGFGLVLGGAPVQLYIISDNVSAALWGHETTSVNFRFGLNIAFGCRQKKKKMDTPLLQSIF